MTRFTSPKDFLGTYLGYYDGRKSLLIIKQKSNDSQALEFDITFTDLDRDIIFRGTAIEGKHPHIIPNLELLEIGGHDGLKWRVLYMHTWNIDYISGVSVANGIEYGMFFERAK